MAVELAGWFGPFRSVERLARGGMGEVWRAEHGVLGQSVAVKTVPAASRRDFDGEVANVSTLAHPGIVQIIDRGFVDEGWGDLAAGTPWLAMELAEGTLAGRPPRGLPAVLEALRQVLDALGHAHGRGILHLDVKPGNLLWQGGRVLVADFGISSLQGRPRVQGWGTPGFAPPEQLRGRWREVGPWTDLFALGQTVRAWVGEDTPLDLWVRRCTQPLPSARFQSAAEAREALGDLEVGGSAPVRTQVCAGATATGAPEAADEPGQRWTRVPFWPRALPDEPAPDPVRPLLSGAGAAVFGQRTVPLVGRAAERAVLWQAFRDVLAHRSPRWVWLTGPSGVGKSRLAEWLVVHAHAAAGVGVWRSVHLGGDGDGLREAARVALGTHGLTGAALERHLAAQVRPDPALAAWLDGRPVTTEGAAAALARALEQLQPVVLWVDDAHHADPELLAAVVARSRGAVLGLGTCRTDGDPPPAPLPGQELPLGPLPESALRTMLGGWLGLAPAAAAEVAWRAEGNALVAAQLVAGAIAEGELHAGEVGLEVDVDGLRLPASATAVWDRRLRQVAGDEAEALQLAAVLGPRFEGAWRRGVGSVDGLVERALRAHVWTLDAGGLRWTHELAREAALRWAEAEGRRVELHRRASRCVDPGEEPGAAGRHLVASGELREGAELLLRAVRAHIARGEWQAVDRADRDLTQVLGQLEGGAELEVERLLERARMAANRWRSDEAWRLLSALKVSIAQVGTRYQRGMVHYLCGQTLLVEHRPREALVELALAMELHGDDPSRRARLLRTEARCLRQLGDVESAIARLRDALDATEGLPDAAVVRADVSLSLAVALHTARRFDEALRAYHDALAGYGDAFPGAVAETWNNLGDLHRHRGEPDAAREAYARAREFIEATGSAPDSMELGLALLLLDTEPLAARALLEGLQRRALGTAQAGFAHLFALPLATDPARFEAHWRSARAQLPELPAEIDVADALDRAIRHGEGHGWPVDQLVAARFGLAR